MKNAADLAKEYLDCILKQREAIFSGSVRDVRRYARKITPTARKLVRMGDDGIREFATLLSHPDKEVRADAAFNLISSLPDGTGQTDAPGGFSPQSGSGAVAIGIAGYEGWRTE